MKNPQFHIGCSAYNNSYWQPLFYPGGLPRSRWFAYYASHFGTYELNASFYRFPTAKSLRNWYDKSPDGFIFSVKAPKVITHLKKFSNCSEEIQLFYTACREGLAEKLGCVLFQLPPSFHYSAERLKIIVDSLDRNFTNVVEFRHESWWIPGVRQTLAAHHIVCCSVSYPGLPETVVPSGEIVYLRLHGNTRLFYSDYPETQLKDWYGRLARTGAKQVYVYFNNTASEAGILNAIAFEGIVERTSV